MDNIDSYFKRNWAGIVLALIAFSIAGYGNAQYALDVNTKLDSFHTTVCVVLAASKQQDKAQAKFYSGAAQRALERAKTDTGSLRQADLDAAASDTNLVTQYQRGEHFNFPGCST